MPPKNKQRSKMETEPGDEEITPISQQQEEEMSSAYIAKLLAEEGMAGNDDAHPYYAEYSNATGPYEQYIEGDDDDDYEDDDSYTPKKGRGGKRTSAFDISNLITRFFEQSF